MRPVAVPCPQCVGEGRRGPGIVAYVHRLPDGQVVAVTGLDARRVSEPTSLPAEVLAKGPFRGATWVELTGGADRTIALVCKRHGWIHVRDQDLQAMTHKRR